MSQIFLNLVNISITESWLVLAIIIFRLVLKKAPKYIICALWALVAVRLIFPISIESPLSLVPSGETIPLEIEYSKTPTIDTGITSLNTAVNPIIQENFTPSDELTSMNPIQLPIYIGAYLWQIGIVIMALYAIISYIRIKLKVREAIKIDGNVYECDRIPSPFILGVIRPRIYLPSSLSEEAANHVIAHEKAHLKRLDYIWKPLGYVLLTVYWFNPVMWLGYILLCRDIEYACDEKVVKTMSLDAKKEYSTTLLNLSVHNRYVTACPLAFGESGVKSRIKSVLNYKKPAFWVIIVAIILCVVMAVCFLTNPMPKSFESETSAPYATYHKGKLYFNCVDGIYSCDKNFENVEYLTEGYCDYSFVDNYVLYYIGESFEHTASIEAINLKTLSHKELYSSEDTNIYYLAPVGNNFIFANGDNLITMNSKGEILSKVVLDNSYVAYSNDDFLLYTTNMNTEIKKYDFKLGDTTSIFTLTEGSLGWRVHYDGKYVYYTHVNGSDNSFCRYNMKSGKTEVLLEEGFGWEFVIDGNMCYFAKGVYNHGENSLYAFNIKTKKVTSIPCPAAGHVTGLQLFGDYLIINSGNSSDHILSMQNLRDNSFYWIYHELSEKAGDVLVPQYIKGEIYDILNGNIDFTDFETNQKSTIATLPLTNDSFYGTTPEEYCIIDLDNDGTEEIVVRYSNSGNTAIIHKDKTHGNWTSYYVPFRGSTPIKFDGTMIRSGGAASNRIWKASFTTKGLEPVDIIINDATTGEYSINGNSASQEECNKAFDEFYIKPDAEFVSFSTNSLEYNNVSDESKKYMNDYIIKFISQIHEEYPDATFLTIDMDNNGLEETWYCIISPTSGITSHIIAAYENDVLKYMTSIVFNGFMHLTKTGDKLQLLCEDFQTKEINSIYNIVIENGNVHPILMNTKEQLQIYSGEYSFGETWPNVTNEISHVMDYILTIYDNGSKANLSINGFQTMIDYVCDVKITYKGATLYLKEYASETSRSHNIGSELLSIKRTRDGIITTWGAVQPALSENADNPYCFEKISTEASPNIYPIVINQGNSSSGYVVGGLVNGKLVNLQDGENYKLFELTGNEQYTLISAQGNSTVAESTDIKSTFIGATGTYEIQVAFPDSNNNQIGIGNLNQAAVGVKTIIDENGSFSLDFDNDGTPEKILIEKTSDNTIIITLENNQGQTELASFNIDGTYTILFDIFTVDIDQNNSIELILSLHGHDYSTEIFKITSTSHTKVIDYYMGN